ncbi:MAG: TolC family protein [Candidatus Firestonebacteria bacterium]
MNLCCNIKYSFVAAKRKLCYISPSNLGNYKKSRASLCSYINIKKTLIIILIFLISQAVILAADETSKLSLLPAIKEAIANNPELKMISKKLESSKIKASKMGVLDEPRFGIGFLNLPVSSFSFGEMDETMKEFKFMQMFPFPGKLSLREQVGIFESDIVNEEYRQKKNEIMYKVKTSYYELYLVLKSVEIVKKNKDLLGEIIKIANAKYLSSDGLQGDVLRAQVEFAQMMNELIMLEQKRKTAEAQINTLLFRNTEISISGVEEVTKIKSELTFGTIKQTAIENSPLLKLSDFNLKRNEIAHSLAKKEYFPDFDLGVAYSQRDSAIDGTKRNDMFSIMLAVNLPFLWGPKSYEVDSTKIEIDEAQANYDSIKNEIFYMIKDILSEIEKADRMLNLFETGILPQAKQVLEITKANYQSGKVDFLALLDAQRTLYKYEVENYNIIVEYEKNLATLEFIAGKNIGGKDDKF